MHGGRPIHSNLSVLRMGFTFRAQGRDSTKMRDAPATLAVVGGVVALSLLVFGGLLREPASVPKNPTVSENGGVVFVGAPSGFPGETLGILKLRFSGPTLEGTEICNPSSAATQ